MKTVSDFQLSCMAAPAFPSPYRLYDVGHFENADLKLKIEAKVFEFNIYIRNWLMELMNKGKELDLYHQLSPISGVGAFTTKSIKAGTEVMTVFATIQDPESFLGDRTYCFATTMDIRGEKIPIILDGLPALAAMNSISDSQKTADQRMLDNINGSRSNHSCVKYNTQAKWIELDGVPAVVYYTTEDVSPFQELTSNYNSGTKPANTVAFFRRISALKKEGCPDHLIQECKCSRNPYSYGSQKCPKDLGYDKRIMFPAAYPETDSEHGSEYESEPEPEPEAEPSPPKRRSSARFA
jgi:hypothetical protein